MEVLELVAALVVGISLLGTSARTQAADFVVGESFHGEYCQHEKFEARCLPDQVIVIERALFGRMRLGRCVKTDFGFIGCFHDVIATLDATCSGLRSCELTVTDPMFEERGTPCNPEFKNYLEVSYKCVSVAALASESCVLQIPQGGREKTGVLPSMLSRERPCGSDLIPWTIKASEGQRINISLLDFGPPPATRSHTVIPNICYKYGSVFEVKTETTMDVCAGAERQTHVYTSMSNQLEVVLTHNPSSQFILLYEAVGCPNYPDSPTTWSRAATDASTNTLLVGCRNNDNQVWSLVCRDTRWTGFVGNCTDDADELKTTSKGHAQQSRILPPGLTIGVILGVAITISICIVVIGLVCLRRIRRRRRNRNHHHHHQKDGILLKPSSACATVPGSTVSERIYNPSCYLDPDDSLLDSVSHRDPYYACRSDYGHSRWTGPHRHAPSCGHYSSGFCARGSSQFPSATAGLDLVQTENLLNQRDSNSRSMDCNGSRDFGGVSRDCSGSRNLIDTAQSEL